MTECFCVCARIWVFGGNLPATYSCAAARTVSDASLESFATSQDLITYEAQVRRRLNDFINCLAEDDLRQVHEHETRRGSFRATVSQTLLHLVNHATYHRGQVACLLKLHGVDFADTDFIIWLNQTQT